MTYVPTLLRTHLRVEAVIMIHYFEYAPDFRFAGESHPFWEAVYVDHGAVEIRADDRLHRLERGEMLFHAPGEFHTLRACDGRAPDLFIISFIADGPGMDFFRQRRCRPDHRDRDDIAGIIREGRRAFLTPLHLPQEEQLVRAPGDHADAEQMIRNHLEMMLIRMKRRAEEAAGDAGAPDPHLSYLPASEDASDPEMVAVIDYLRAHLADRLSVEAIAEATHMSRSRLQALFRRAAGCGVSAYFHRMKIEAAKVRLRTSDRSISALAMELGYASLSTFSKKFKQLTGYSPKAYRSSVRALSKR